MTENSSVGLLQRKPTCPADENPRSKYNEVVVALGARDGWYCAGCGAGLADPTNPLHWEWVPAEYDYEFCRCGRCVELPCVCEAWWRPRRRRLRATRDHIFPRSLGGSDDLDNLRLLCRPCNSKKGARVY